MEAVSLRDIANVTAEDFLRDRPQRDPTFGRELTAAIELALLTAVRAERRECAAECRRRAELWERTADRPGSSDPARQEARSRANEAAYLADALATRT